MRRLAGLGIWFTAILLMSAGCGGGDTAEPVLRSGDSAKERLRQPQDIKQEMAAIAADVVATIGAGQCSRSAECGALPMGAKPCGGPWGYLPYSIVNTDTTRLNQLAEQYAQLNKELNDVEQLSSDCAITPEPAVACVDNACQTISPAAGVLE